MRKVRADFEAGPEEFNSEHDHVRLPVHYPPIASVSARMLRSEHTGRVSRHFWSPVLLRRLVR